MKYTDNQLKDVISALEKDLSQAFEAAKPGMLAKAAPGDMPPEATDDSAISPSSADAGAPSPAPEAASAPMDPSASPEAEAAPAPEASADPAAEEAMTPEKLQAEYAQLSPEELDMHLQAAMAAKEALGAASAGAPGGMPPGASAAPAGMPPSAPPEMAPPAMKAEIKASPGNGGVMKSEVSAALDLFKAELASMKEQLDAKDALIKSQSEDVQNLTKAVSYVFEAPQRKAITQISQLGKSESKPTYTLAEVKTKLNELIPTLSKSERDLVLGYYSGTVKADKLINILDKASK